MKLLRSLISLQICNRSMSSLSRNTSVNDYDMKRVLLVSKNTRYQYEKHNNPDMSNDQLRQYLMSQGTENYVHSHEEHMKFEKRVINALHKAGVEVKTVVRCQLTENVINWADTVISVGGDGTFLMAASKITEPNKPVIGFNSCPDTSTGYLCLPKCCSKNVEKTIELIKEKQFTWSYRTRIRITLRGNNIDKKWKSIHERIIPSNEGEEVVNNLSPNDVDNVFLLPHLGLNEVFAAENNPANVSYISILTDNSENISTKSSGIIICTGSGSTSWTFTMNRVSTEEVSKILEIGGVKANAKLIANKYNRSLKFPPDDSRLHFTIRDLIPTPDWPKMPDVTQCGFVKNMTLESHMKDGYLILDGAYAYKFNLGTIANIDTSPDVSLKTIKLNNVEF